MAEKKDSLLAKLDQLQQRFIKIEKQLSEPEISRDPARLIKLSKEQGKLKALVSLYRQYNSAIMEIEDARQIIDDSSAETDFRQLAKEEIRRLEERKADLLKEMQNKLVTADDEAIDSVVMEIRAGTGGDEAALFARDLYNMYIKYAENHRWKVEQLSFSTTERGGFREVIFSVKGPRAWSDLGYEGGGHRVQRIPETEAQGRIHTSAATVAVLPEPQELEIDINPDDVLEHVCRSGGPGGQSVNKLNSAIKLEHIPTGITVSMQDEKSQHKNRAKAWRILRLRVYEHFTSRKRALRDSQRKTMIGSGDRSQKIRTYNYPQNRLTDHRINLSLYSLDKVMAGDMDQLIAAIKEYDIKQRLENL
jgi:peptide chain release factor 1